jgi:nitronate monooxygenase
MPIDTTLTTRLGIAHPILSAPMAPIAGARLVAAVSEAGGFGILGRGSGDRPAPFTGRALVNDHARRWMGREVELIQNVDAVARVAGNFDIAGVFAGEGVGLIHDIPKASEIVERITLEAEQVLEGRRNSATVPQAAVARRPQQQASKRTSCGRIAE